MNRLIVLSLLGLVALTGCGPSVQEQRNLAITKFQQNHFDEARIEFHQVLNRQPADAPSFYYLGLMDQADGKMTHAIYYYQCALTADPSMDAAREELKKAKGQSPTGETLIFLPTLGQEPRD